MTESARAEIRRLIRQHTERNTVSAEAARAALVRRGLYTDGGELTPEYGGPQQTRTDGDKT